MIYRSKFIQQKDDKADPEAYGDKPFRHDSKAQDNDEMRKMGRKTYAWVKWSIFFPQLFCAASGIHDPANADKNTTVHNSYKPQIVQCSQHVKCDECDHHDSCH